jgi:ABC-type polysaccharide/polyol phosphate transport system ATPase subunit
MNALTLTGISKKFEIYDNSRARLKELLLLGRRNCHRDLWALKDINFEVPKGQSLGIIGRNGSGKSTLLKLIAGISQPTEGTIRTEGRVSALLELGAGFHPEFTGLDNIFMNAALLGIEKKLIDERLKDIVEFSELGDFINVPVKFYSSGMAVRLGFSVAIHLDPDILVIDEALGVGDIKFQRKCMNAMREFKRKGTTIILVTHSLGDLGGFCDRTILIESGKVIKDDSTEKVIEFYRSSELKSEESETGPWNPLSNESKTSVFSKEVEITKVKFIDEDGLDTARVKPGKRLTVRISYVAKEPVCDPVFRIVFFRDDGMQVFGTNTARRGFKAGELSGDGEIEVVIDQLNLNFGRYYLSVGVSKDEYSSFTSKSGYDYKHMEYVLDVERDFTHGGGLVYCPNEWRKV